MSLSSRSHYRFPVCCGVTYEHWLHEGQGTVWNLSATGWWMSGNLPLQCGDVCSFQVVLPTRERVSVAAGIVRWVNGYDYGVETLVMDREAHDRLREYIRHRTKQL
jgi:hypothetical protein